MLSAFRKFTVARLAPKKYGDHISHNVKGAGSSNFQPQILIQCSSAGDDEGYIDISAAPEAAGSLPQQGNGNSAVSKAEPSSLPASNSVSPYSIE